MKQRITVEYIDVDSLLDLIGDLIERKLHKLDLSPPDNSEYLTRIELSKWIKISLPTINDYTKKGILKAYRIGGRVLYQKSEVVESLKEIRTSRNR